MVGLGLAAEELRLVLLTHLARGSLLAAATVLDAALPDYDTSKSIMPVEWGQSAAAGSTGSVLLRGWAVWDAVFFSDIAARGYVYEQYYAFFPLLPGEPVKLLCTGQVRVLRTGACMPQYLRWVLARGVAGLGCLWECGTGPTLAAARVRRGTTSVSVLGCCRC